MMIAHRLGTEGDFTKLKDDIRSLLLDVYNEGFDDAERAYFDDDDE